MVRGRGAGPAASAEILMAEGATKGKEGSSDVRWDGVAARPSAQSCRYIKEPFACTASVIWKTGGLSLRVLYGGGERTHLLPCGDLGVGPDPRDVGVPARFCRDERPLCDQEGPGHACALAVVLLYVRQGDVLCVRAEPSEGAHHDAMLEEHLAHADGLE